MNTQFVIVFFVFVVFIYFFYYCTETFTDNTLITPTPTCPKGGKFHKEKKSCIDKIQGTYGCSGRYHLEADGLCYGPPGEGVYHVQGYYCPDKYEYGYDTKNGTCVRKYGKPTLTCPNNGYDLITQNNKYFCKKKNT